MWMLNWTSAGLWMHWMKMDQKIRRSEDDWIMKIWKCLRPPCRIKTWLCRFPLQSHFSLFLVPVHFLAIQVGRADLGPCVFLIQRLSMHSWAKPWSLNHQKLPGKDFSVWSEWTESGDWTGLPGSGSSWLAFHCWYGYFSFLAIKHLGMLDAYVGVLCCVYNWWDYSNKLNL